jgi:hypothetical protein
MNYFVLTFASDGSLYSYTRFENKKDAEKRAQELRLFYSALCVVTNSLEGYNVENFN